MIDPTPFIEKAFSRLRTGLPDDIGETEIRLVLEQSGLLEALAEAQQRTDDWMSLADDRLAEAEKLEEEVKRLTPWADWAKEHKAVADDLREALAEAQQRSETLQHEIEELNPWANVEEVKRNYHQLVRESAEQKHRIEELERAGERAAIDGLAAIDLLLRENEHLRKRITELEGAKYG